METLAFFVFAAAWLALPLVPALRELHRPVDATPLNVAADNAADPLGPFEQAERLLRHNPSLERAQMLEATGVLRASAHEPWQGLAAHASAVWVDGTLKVDDSVPAHVRALRATSAIVQPAARLSATLAVDATARLLPGCEVRTVQAACVRAGVQERDTREDSARRTPSAARLDAGGVEGATWHELQGWWHAPKTACVDKGVCVDGDVVSAGDLSVGSGSVVRGSLKAAGRVVVREGSRIEGSVVAKNVDLGAGVFVTGSVVADEKAVLGPSCWVGETVAPATVLARDIVLYEGTGVCGAVVAHRAARVV